MADLAVTAHQHSEVAFSARPNSSGSKAETAFAFSLEQLLQGGMMLRHPPAADLLRAEREPVDPRGRADVREADEIANLSRKRARTRRPETIDHRQDADAAPPVPQETDHQRRTSADIDGVQHPGERADRPEAHPLAEPADAAAAPQPSDTGRPVNAAPQSPRHAAQGIGMTAPSGIALPPLAGAAEPDEPATTAPASGPLTASVSREADVLVSHSSSALAPTAALAAEHFQGPGHRPRPASPGAPSGVMSAPAAPVPGGNEAPVSPVAEVAARLDANGRPVASQTAGTLIAGTTDPGGAAAGAQAAQGQIAAMTAATGTAASPLDKTMATTPSAATASDTRGPAGIAAGPALGAQAAATRAAGPETPARTEPFQPRTASDQVSVHIKKAVQEGTDRIEIRLKPEALGRVDVRLELGPEGRVVATVTADQRHTLELLRSDARSLERALQEAGLQTDGGSLNFHLRSGDDGRPGQHEGRPPAASLPAGHGADGGGGQTAPPASFGRGAARPDGIDIHA